MAEDTEEAKASDETTDEEAKDSELETQSSADMLAVDEKTLAIVKAHMDHAEQHGLIPGANYVLHLANDPTPVVGKLIGTNDLGVVFHAFGSAMQSFHPWTNVKSLVHSGQ